MEIIGKVRPLWYSLETTMLVGRDRLTVVIWFSSTLNSVVAFPHEFLDDLRTKSEAKENYLGVETTFNNRRK